MKLAVVFTIFAFLCPGLALANCGGGFSSFVDGLKSEARDRGYSRAQTEAFFSSVQKDDSVLKADRRQGIFTRAFLDFSSRLISTNRFENGRRNAKKWDSVFDNVERSFGVSRGVIRPRMHWFCPLYCARQRWRVNRPIIATWCWQMT